MVNTEEIGQRIRQAREALGWSQTQLGAKLGVSHISVGRWERGVMLPSRKRMKELAKVLGHSEQWFMGESEAKNEELVSEEDVMPLARAPTDIEDWRKIARDLAEALRSQSEAQKLRAQADVLAQQNIQRALEQASPPLAPGRGGADAASGDE